MEKKTFWSRGTTRFLVVLITFCMVVEVGWVDTAAFYVVVLGMWAACRILSKEQ